MLVSSDAFAAVIADFRFDGNTYSVDPSNATGANTGLHLASSVMAQPGIASVSDLQFSAGLDPTAALGFGATEYNDALGFSTDVNADRNLLTSNQTIYFDIGVQSGYRLNLESLSFDSLKTRAGNDTGSRVTHSIFVNPAGDPSLDGLAGAIDFVQNLAHDHFAPGESGAESTGADFSTGRWATGPVSLTGFGNLTGSNRIAIRLYASEGLDRDFGIDNLVLVGEAVSVPEPGMVGVLFAISAAMTTVRRRRSS